MADDGMNNYAPERVGATSDKGPVRPANEDAFWLSDADAPTDLGALYLVADGVGGQEHGAAAAQLAITVVSQEFYRLRQNGVEIPSALESAIRQANQAIYDQAQARGGGKMGCTLVAAVQHDGILQVAHVGDARAYLFMGNRLRRLTRDDTWVQKQVEAGIITAEQAAKHELRNVVTQVLGNKPEIEVHLSRAQPLYTGDIFMLSSDGVHDVLDNAQILSLLKENPPQAAAEALVKAAIDADTKDNATAVVVHGGLIPGRERATAVPLATVGVHPNRRLPLWATITLAAAALAVIIWGAYTIFAPDEPESLLEDDTSSAPEISIPALEQTDTPLPELATVPATEDATAVSLPTSTIRPPDTATPPPTNTPTATPVPRACVIADAFLWQEEQLTDGDCDQFAQETLAGGTEILILDSTPRTVNGPDSSCQANDFIEVQSVTEPETTGWILAIYAEPLAEGASCAP